MSKKAKFWIIFLASLKTIGIFLIFLFIAHLIKINIPENMAIGYILKKIDHNSSLVYTDNKDIYYNGENYKSEDIILWIDDNCIIYQKETRFYYTDNSETKELSLGDIEIINNGTLFLVEDRIYFKNIKTYYLYYLKENELSIISKENYMNAKNGNKYSISLEPNYNITSISIIEKETSIKKTVDNNTLKKLNSLKEINQYIKFRLFNYSIFDDTIYLYLYAGPFSIIVTYDFKTEKIKIFDWFYRKESRTCYLAFKINDINNVPVLKDYIK